MTLSRQHFTSCSAMSSVQLSAMIKYSRIITQLQQWKEKRKKKNWFRSHVHIRVTKTMSKKKPVLPVVYLYNTCALCSFKYDCYAHSNCTLLINCFVLAANFMFSRLIAKRRTFKTDEIEWSNNSEPLTNFKRWSLTHSWHPMNHVPLKRIIDCSVAGSSHRGQFSWIRSWRLEWLRSWFFIEFFFFK